MERIVNIQNVDPNNFQLQDYSPSDNTLISNYTEQNIAFDPTQDYLEYFIFDLNQNILFSNLVEILYFHQPIYLQNLTLLNL